MDKTPYFYTEHLQNTPYKINDTEQLTTTDKTRKSTDGILAKIMKIGELHKSKTDFEKTGYRANDNLQSRNSSNKNIQNSRQEPIQQNNNYNYFEGTIDELYKHALNSKTPNSQKAYKLKLSNVQPNLLQALDGKEGYEKVADDYVHTIDDSAIRHINKKHGSPRTEIPHGQLPIGIEDFERIPDLLETFEKIRFGEDHKRTPLIGFGKDYPDGATAYIEEVREKRKELSAKSMYKAKKKLRDGFQLMLDDDDAPRKIPAPRKQNFTNGLNEETVKKILKQSKAKAANLPPKEPSVTNWREMFGENGYTPTPAGNIRTGPELFKAMQNIAGQAQFNWFAATLKKPGLIIEIPDEKGKKPDLLYVRTFDNGKRQHHYVIDITNDGNGNKNCRQWHTESERNLKKILETGVPVYIADNE